MLFRRRRDARIALNALRAVIANILPDQLNKPVSAGEPSAVTAFPFQNVPEALRAPRVTRSAPFQPA